MVSFGAKIILSTITFRAAVCLNFDLWRLLCARCSDKDQKVTNRLNLIRQKCETLSEPELIELQRFICAIKEGQPCASIFMTPILPLVTR